MTSARHFSRLVSLLCVLAFAVTAFAAPSGMQGEGAPPPTPPAGVKTLVFFGDSLTAGYGLDDPAGESFPGVIRKKISAEHLPWRVINAGLSGETTSGGAKRVDWILRQPVDLFVLALGGNDGLRGIDPAVSEVNLQHIIDKVHAKYPDAKIVLTGMMMPTNFGEDYRESFAAIYPALAKKNHLLLVPFLLKDVGGETAMNQPDGIHPTAKGHAVVAETLWEILRPLL